MSSDNTGPAFPQSQTSTMIDRPIEIGEGGLTVREYYAGQALAGLTHSSLVATDEEEMENHQLYEAMTKQRQRIADAAFNLADEMVKRGKL